MTYERTPDSLALAFPRPVIQQDERACLSACLLSQLEPNTGSSEVDVTRILTEANLFSSEIGTGLYPAKVLNHSIGRLGLSARAVYDARLSVEDEAPRIADRLVAVQATLNNGDKVLVAYPKRRPGRASFLHYAVLARLEDADDALATAAMDPSEIDGGVFQLTTEALAGYVTPDEDVPVMAWAISQTPTVWNREHPSTASAGRIGSELLVRPLYLEADTGKAVPPGTEHACSVALPTTALTAQFASIGDVILSRNGEHPFGYPRFVEPPAVRELALATTGQFDSLPFPTLAAAQATAGLDATYGQGVTIHQEQGLFWVPGTYFTPAGWQHSGLGISSRQAAATLAGKPENDVKRRSAAEQDIKSIIERQTGAQPEDIYLFPTGMAGIYWLNQALIKMSGSAPGVQFGFPYTDTFEQRKFGPDSNIAKNCIDIRDGDYEKLSQSIATGQRIRSVFTEYPSNPLLTTPDFGRLDSIVGDSTPIIIDDTIGTMMNLDGAKLPDSVAARVTSLTKFFSSTGDVMGGSVVLRPESPHYEQLKQALDELYDDTMWYEDAEVLAKNGQDFETTMPVINRNGACIAGWLDAEWTGGSRPLQTVHYPGLGDTAAYDSVRKYDGGYGGLMTLRFNDADRAYNFFDELRITKGPGLGTFYTLGCLYTRLAHKPFRAVAKFGVVPDLVRISTGIEPIDELKDRFETAFQQTV